MKRKRDEPDPALQSPEANEVCARVAQNVLHRCRYFVQFTALTADVSRYQIELVITTYCVRYHHALWDDCGTSGP